MELAVGVSCRLLLVQECISVPHSRLWRNGKQHCKKRQKCSGNWTVNLVHPFVGATIFIFVSVLLFVLFAVFRPASMYDGTASFVLGDLMSYVDSNLWFVIRDLQWEPPICSFLRICDSCRHLVLVHLVVRFSFWRSCACGLGSVTKRCPFESLDQEVKKTTLSVVGVVVIVNSPQDHGNNGAP